MFIKPPVPIKPFVIAALISVFMLIATACESQRQKDDKEFVRVDASPHVNLVKQAQQDWSWITGTTWMVASIQGDAPLPDSELWIRFEDHTWLTGSAGCNRITGSYSRKGIDGLRVSEIASTRMHCPAPEGIMQQESRFLHLFEQCDSYTAEPDRLVLYTNGIEMLIFSRADSED